MKLETRSSLRRMHRAGWTGISWRSTTCLKLETGSCESSARWRASPWPSGEETSRECEESEIEERRRSSDSGVPRGYQEILASVAEGSDSKVEHKMRCLLESVRGEAKVSEWNREQLEGIECEIRFAQEEQPEQTQAQSTDEQEVTGGLGEVRSGRGTAGLVRGEMRCVGRDETMHYLSISEKCSIQQHIKNSNTTSTFTARCHNASQKNSLKSSLLINRKVFQFLFFCKLLLQIFSAPPFTSPFPSPPH